MSKKFKSLTKQEMRDYMNSMANTFLNTVVQMDRIISDKSIDEAVKRGVRGSSTLLCGNAIVIMNDMKKRYLLDESLYPVLESITAHHESIQAMIDKKTEPDT